MNRHWSYPFIAMKWNTFPGTRLGSVFCSYLEFQPVWHFEHLRCWLFSCSWSNFRCLSLSLLPAETGYIDPVLIEKYNTPGFVGCLSRVQFNSIAPLKAALRSRGSAPVSHQGKLVESNCGASPLTIPPMSAATDPWHLDAGEHV